MTRYLLASLLLFGLLSVAPRSAFAQLEIVGDDARLAHLGAEIERLAEASRGNVGVAVLHLESGRGLTLRGNESFPMASTYKVPIAVEILAQIDAGKRSLGDLVTVERSDLGSNRRHDRRSARRSRSAPDAGEPCWA